MSGGYFDYNQYRIDDVAEQVENFIKDSGFSFENFDNQVEKTIFDKDTIEKLKEGYVLLRKASIFAQRIDWLVSGDDSESTFHKRLKEDLEEFESLMEDKFEL